MITAENWRKYLDRLAAIDEKAADLMRLYIEQNGLQDSEALIQYAYALATKYGEASATLACEMYDYMAGLMQAGVPGAIPAETATLEEVAKGVNWGKYHSPSQIPSIVSRQVRQAGADSMLQNAARDGAQWAWIPAPGETCAFCIMLASNGWQYASEAIKKGNHADHIHEHCDCTFAIAFKPKDREQYDYVYDPKKYEEMYNSAEGKTWEERVNFIRRQIYQERKDAINAQKRDAYAARQLEKQMYRDAENDVNALRRQINAEKKEKSQSESERWWDEKFKDVTKEYIEQATPGIGLVEFDKGLSKKRSKDELAFQALIHSLFGGDITALNSNNYPSRSPDFIWNNKLWELKTPQGAKNLNKLIETAIIQISSNTRRLPPGGIFLDLSNVGDETKMFIEEAMHRIAWKADFSLDLLVIKNGRLVSGQRWEK